MSFSRRWMRWLPWLSLAAFSSLWLAHWPIFPLVLDPYYHLLIARQVAEAGGPIVYEWWQYAPIGRFHLYPPLLHLLLAGFLKLGIPAITTIRIASVVLLPALLLSLWLVMRRLLGPSIALASLWVGMVPFSFHLHSVITMAATLSLIEWLWLMDALEHGRILAAGLLLALLCYTHLGLPWIVLVTIGICGCLRPDCWKRWLRASWGLLLVVPWWWHLWSHRMSLVPFPRDENRMVELMPLVYLAAAVGVWRCWVGKGAFRWLPACWLGFSLLAFEYRYRWLSGEGLFAVILLAGVGVDWLAGCLAACGQRLRIAPSQRSGRDDRLTSRETGNGGQNSGKQLLWAGAIVGLLLCSGTLAFEEDHLRWRWPDSGLAHLAGIRGVQEKDLDQGLYTPVMERLIRVVSEQTQPLEILWSNAPYVLGLIAAVVGRPMSSAMLNEVRPERAFDSVAAAHWIVWFKFDQPPELSLLKQIQRYPLRRVYEEDLAIVFRQESPIQPAHPPQAILPVGMAFGILGVVLGLVVWDLRMGAPQRYTQGASMTDISLCRKNVGYEGIP